MPSNTKPRHTTCKKRHGAADRQKKRLLTQDRLTAELRQAMKDPETFTHENDFVVAH